MSRIQSAYEIVQEQAEDEALWAVYPKGEQPITEAYLQQELRRLHEAVAAEYNKRAARWDDSAEMPEGVSPWFGNSVEASGPLTEEDDVLTERPSWWRLRRVNGFRPLLCWLLPHRMCRWQDPDDCPVHHPRQPTPNCPHSLGFAVPHFCYACQPDGRAAARKRRRTTEADVG